MAAAIILPKHSSTFSTAFISALTFPVWPTISGLAKLTQIKSGFSLVIASKAKPQTSSALISGCKSYVATLGDGAKCLVSPIKGCSLPPLKKKVT